VNPLLIQGDLYQNNQTIGKMNSLDVNWGGCVTMKLKVESRAQSYLKNFRTESAGVLDDLWSLDLSNPKNVSWVQIKTIGLSPPARSLHAFTSVDNSLFLFGGGPQPGSLSFSSKLLHFFNLIILTALNCSTNRFLQRHMAIQNTSRKMDKLLC
jgi:hypothetical protein